MYSNSKRVPNNMDYTAKRIVAFMHRPEFSRVPRPGLRVVADDGSVIVNLDDLPHFAYAFWQQRLMQKFGHLRVGDGVQEGEICFVVAGQYEELVG